MSHPFFVFTGSELIYLIAVFILGIILGATVLNLYVSQKVDQLILENRNLNNKLEEHRMQIEKLEKNLEQQKYSFIQDISIKLKSDLNRHNQQAVTEKIKQLLSGIVGREITGLDPLLLRDVINNRYIKIEDKTFRLQLVYTVIGENVELYIVVHSPGAAEDNNE